MAFISHSRWFWLLLLLTVAGEFILPWLLKPRYPGYDSRRMVMSVLGCPASPVKYIYRAWLIWMGCLLTVTAFVFFHLWNSVSTGLAVAAFCLILVFSVGAGLLSGLFSVNETKDMTTAGAKVHGAGAALGFLALLFFPLCSSIAAFRQRELSSGWLFLGSFLAALVFFCLFVMADKEQFRGTKIAFEGRWQRFSLAAMYVPFVSAVNMLLAAE